MPSTYGFWIRMRRQADVGHRLYSASNCLAGPEHNFNEGKCKVSFITIITLITLITYYQCMKM